MRAGRGQDRSIPVSYERTHGKRSTRRRTTVRKVFILGYVRQAQPGRHIRPGERHTAAIQERIAHLVNALEGHDDGLGEEKEVVTVDEDVPSTRSERIAE